MITVSRSKINAFENKNAFLVDMFLSQYTTHVVEYFGKDSSILVPEEHLETIAKHMLKDLAIQPKLGFIVEESK